MLFVIGASLISGSPLALGASQAKGKPRGFSWRTHRPWGIAHSPSVCSSLGMPLAIWLKVPPANAELSRSATASYLTLPCHSAAMSRRCQVQVLNANLRQFAPMVQESVVVPASSQHTPVCLAFT
jgi:hypothetical protein